MKIVFRQALRNILKTKKIGVLLSVVMTISMAILYLNISVTQNIVENYERLLRSVYGNAEISIMSPKEFRYEDVHLNGLADNQVIKVYKMDTKPDEKFQLQTTSSTRFADLEECVEYGLLNLYEGSISNLKKDSIIVSREFANENNLSLGDNVSVICEGKQFVFCLDGIAENTGIYSLPAEKANFFADYSFIYNILGDKPGMEPVTGLFIGIDKSQNAENIYTELKQNNNAVIIQKNIDSKALSESLESFKQIMLFVLIISTLLNVFIVYSVLKLVVLRRKPIIATYRSIGAGNLFPVKLLGCENLVYLSIAGVLNAIIAPWLRGIFIKNFLGITNKNISKIGFGDSFLYLLGCFAVVAVIVLFVTLSVSRQMGKSSIRAAMFDKPGTELKISYKGMLFGIVIVGASVVICMLNKDYEVAVSIAGIVLFFIGVVMAIIPLCALLVRGIKRLFGDMLKPHIKYALTSISYDKNVAGIIQMATITLAFVFTIVVLLSSLSNMFMVVLGNSDKDYRISNIKGNYRDVVEDISPYAEEICIDYYSETVMNSKEKIIVLGLNHDESAWSQVINISHRDMANNEILLDEYYAMKNNLSIGDEIVISDTYEHERNYKIVDFINSYGWNTSRNVAVINMDEYMAGYSDLPRTISFKSEDLFKEKLEEVARNYGATFTDIEESLKYQKQSTDQLMNSILILVIVCLVMSVIGIINHQYIAIWNRKTEIAIKYSVAMSKKDIFIVLFIEQIIMYAIIYIMSTVAGIGLILFSKNVLFSAGIPMEISFNGKVFAVLVICTIAVMCINAVIPVSVIRKTNIVEEIRAE